MVARRAFRSAWLGLILSCGVAFGAACARQSTLPAALSDREFWALSEALSEPAGTFTISDNFVSNEPHVAENVRRLRRTGGVYIGVGPEQNFSYIARLRPAMAFIVDIRRENRDLHLLYKALFDLSADRADFVARLFSRPRPDALASSASAEEIFRRFDRVAPSAQEYSRTAALVRERLLGTRGLPLSQPDLDWIDRALKAFYDDGPEIQFWGSRPVHGARPTYRELMTAEDATGQPRSFLATEDEFGFVKDLQSRNLIVPVVGDFGGASAIQRVGDYVRQRNEVVHAFYGSNVGVYLSRQQARAFCRNLETLPAAPRASFIERDGVRTLASKLSACQPQGKVSQP